MIVRDGLRFNCCESVLLAVDERHVLPGFDSGILKAASNLGGGVAGVGGVCGALIGGAMAIGLVYGTSGEESPQRFDEVRLRERKMTQGLIADFEARWGDVDCMTLLGCVGCTPDERAKRGEELKARGESHCDEYVDWVTERVQGLLGR